MNITKSCTKCKKEKDILEFHKMRNGLRSECKECRNTYLKEWGRKNPDKKRNQKYRFRYGIDISDYDKMLELQNGGCAICGNTSNAREKDNYFFVDHCHDTGRVRGLLCHKCNQGISRFDDDSKIITNALKYILTNKIKCKDYANSYISGYLSSILDGIKDTK